MTTKELLYIEDVLGHAQLLRTKCTEAASCLRDAELKSYAEEMEKKSEQTFSAFYSLL